MFESIQDKLIKFIYHHKTRHSNNSKDFVHPYITQMVFEDIPPQETNRLNILFLKLQQTLLVAQL